ncbi:MAG: hypothetical protein ABIJ48_11475 [Actinomycetota bacterium]
MEDRGLCRHPPAFGADLRWGVRPAPALANDDGGLVRRVPQRLGRAAAPDPVAPNWAPATTEGSAVTGPSSWVLLSTPADCAAPIAVPTLPAVIPGEAEIDPDTGLQVTGTPVGGTSPPIAWR